MPKRIPVGDDLFAIVDEEDYEWLSEFHWTIKRHHRNVYAKISSKTASGHRTTIMMHQMITGYDQTDHANGYGLDNRRENLRAATNSQNKANMAKPITRNPSSRFKGVSLDKRSLRWRARLTINQKVRQLGVFSTEMEAARAYNAAALEAWGEYAKINELEA